MNEQTERRLSGRHEQFSGRDLTPVFDNVFDMYGFLDRSGRIVSLTGSIFQSTNSNPDLLKGQLFAETAFWQSSENTSRIVEKAIGLAIQGEPAKLLIDFRVSAEKRIPIRLDLNQTRNSDDDAAIFVCARALPADANSKEDEFIGLLNGAETAEIGLWIWDLGPDRFYATAQCKDLFELTAHEDVNYEKFLDAVHDDDRDAFESSLDHARLNGTKFLEEFRVVYSDGNVEWLCTEGRAFLTPDGRPLRMVGLVRKVTEQKRAAAELEKVYERERKALDSAVETNRAMDFFLAFVSHELRSPLNAILGWAKILLTREVDDATRRTALETIERSAQTQTKLINDMVDSSRVASGKIRLEYRPTNLFLIIKNAFEAIKPSADNRNIRVTFDAADEDVYVFGDANRLQQVFGNILSNALKYTHDGGEVAVSLERENDAAFIKVADNGRGISRSSLPNIFKQFSRGDAEGSETRQGLGLGLSIAKILVTKHGGDITAHSEGIGKGAVFTVTLPLTSRDGSALPSAAVRQQPSRGRLDGLRILLVEDDDDSREVLQVTLEQSGASVTGCNSVPSAINSITGPNGSIPDLIISDIAMPDADGYALISHIRGLPEEAGGRVPAIALSAFATEQSRLRAIEAGFDRYATKPFDPDNLIREAAQLTGRLDA